MSASQDGEAGSAVCSRVLDFISAHNLIAPGEKIILGFSGGPDSLALLDIMGALTASGSLSTHIVLAHMNHCMRGEAADRDQEFCRETARRRGLHLVTSVIPVESHRRRGESPEQAARRLRYDFLLQTALAERAAKIAVAHHADDVAETLLLRLIRGCGLYGLAAMPPIRRLKSGSDVSLVRPLLPAYKSEIVEYLNARRLAYRLDQSNTDIKYRRNSIRVHLLPKLQQNSEGAVLKERLFRVNLLACETRSRLETLADAAWDSTVNDLREGGLCLSTKAISAYARPLRTAMFRRAIQIIGGCEGRAPALKRMHWTGLDAMLKKPPGCLMSLPGGLTARREHGAIVIFRHPGRKDTEIHPLHLPGQSGPVAGLYRVCAALEDLSGLGNAAGAVNKDNRMVVHLDADAVELPLSVRTRRPGDRFQPLGAPGMRKLKRFFIDRKIPLRKRDETPLVLDAAGRIIWVAGEEIADFCRVTAETEHVIQLSLERDAVDL